MHYTYDMMIQEHKILAMSIVAFFFFDCILTYIARKKKIKINNGYYNLQKNYNFIALTVIKLLLISSLTYFLINPPGNAGAVWAIAVIYCLTVIVLIKDSVKAFRTSNSEKG